MKKIIIKVIIIMVGIIVSGSAFAENQDKKMHPEDDRPGLQRGDEQPLTEAQIAKIKSILSRYNPTNLSASDARAIHNSFRDAGIRRGPGMLEAIKASGFDPEKLRTLDPPPEVQDKKKEGRNKPDPDVNPQK